MIDLQGFGDQLAFGALMTLEIALGALGLGLVLGLLGAGAKLSRHAPLRMIGETYTTLVRGIPELLVVLIVFFGATIALNSAARGLGFDTYIDVSPYLAGVLALGLTFGAYATEVLRGAFQAVPKGQIEAAHETIQPHRWPGMPSRVRRNMDLLLELFDRTGCRATFFFLGCVAKEHPDLARRCIELGHEVASHG